MIRTHRRSWLQRVQSPVASHRLCRGLCRGLYGALALTLSLATSTTSRAEDVPPVYTAYPPAAVITTHSISINGREIHYEAEAGTIALVDGKRSETARIFYIAYRMLERSPAEHAKLIAAFEADPAGGIWPTNEPARATRPITFSFNGGPGSSSVWLHLGIFGPRRIDFADQDGRPGPPPFALTDNEASLLDVTDFVFIDPVSTGYSRASEGTEARDFHGVDSDIDSIAEFIRRVLTRERRWSSPKFIAGESYGTTRASGLADALWQQHGIALNGVILISSILDFGTVRTAIGNDLAYAMHVPTFTAIAHHHQMLAADLQARPIFEVLKDARHFVRASYAGALLAGDALEEGERNRIVAGLERFTGLSRDFLIRSRLRVDQSSFCKELLRSRGLTVGRLDGRFTGRDRDDAGNRPEFDPSYAAIRGNFTAGLNAYVREELGFLSDLPYEILGGIGGWDYGRGAENRFLNVADRLRRAMHEQPCLKVFVASGTTDLATPFGAAEHVFSHLGLADELRANITMELYDAGHMMYIDADERARLSADLRTFINASTPPANRGGE